MERTEEKKLTQQGDIVQFGAKEFEIKPLTMRKALKWREGISPLLASMFDKDGALASRETLRAAINDCPRLAFDAVASYLEFSEEQREELLDSATEAQVMNAFFIVMRLAFFPLVGQRVLAAGLADPTLIEKTLRSPAPSKLQ
jgi:hypothetical protein